MNNIFRIDSIFTLHEIWGYSKPKHPLVTLIDISKLPSIDGEKNIQVISNLYNITLKNNCSFKYGRQNYDFSEASLMFISPEQLINIDDNTDNVKQEGWMLCFHPDLIRPYELSRKIGDFTFFSYNISEALHLSEKEKHIITNIIKIIENELSENIDEYTNSLIISNIELLLTYSKRFYSRQFITRSTANIDTVNRFNILLRDYFNSKKLQEKGIPSVKYLAEEMGYSANYLGDLLKKETGKNAQEHIQMHLIEKAKTLLINSSEPIYKVAYMLGFEYPAHFSKFFKAKVGISPIEYRK